jgi:hypothetical protein
LEDYISDPAYELALLNTIASVLTGVKVENIFNLTVTAAEEESRRRLSLFKEMNNVGILVTYVIKINLESVGSSVSFDSLRSDLISSTSGGANATFSQFLITHGGTFGATLFAEGVAVPEEAVVELIRFEPATDDSVDNTADDTDDDNSEPVLDDGALAAIIVGAIAFVMIIVTFVFCMVRKRQTSLFAPNLSGVEQINSDNAVVEFSQIYSSDSGIEQRI